MGMIRIETWGSFPPELFTTCAESGGHVAALKRAILWLTHRLGDAVAKDAQLTKDGSAPRDAPLGRDAP